MRVILRQYQSIAQPATSIRYHCSTETHQKREAKNDVMGMIREEAKLGNLKVPENQMEYTQMDYVRHLAEY
jgi:hypothetical protein